MSIYKRVFPGGFRTLCAALFPARALTAETGSCIMEQAGLSAFDLFAIGSVSGIPILSDKRAASAVHDVKRTACRRKVFRDMGYSEKDVLAYVKDEDVKFVKLAFCDAFGTQKNISVLASQLPRAFEEGIPFDASAIRGFAAADKSGLLLCPDPSTLSVLPWRPSHGRVIRLFCDILHADRTPFEADCRRILSEAAAAAAAGSVSCRIGAEFEFYLFQNDEAGNPTAQPFDRAGYFDIAPLDKGENVRREICCTLEEMGIVPETSHHEEGPGQNEIDFCHSEPLAAADNALTFKNVVRMAAARNGLTADFSAKPIPDEPGNSQHIHLSVQTGEKAGRDSFAAGILAHIAELTVFLNPTEASYRRLAERKAPRYITWSRENRSQLLHIPELGRDGGIRMELRSPDPSSNPYLAYALLIYAGLDGIRRGLTLPEPVNAELCCAPEELVKTLAKLPGSIEEAAGLAVQSEFVKRILPSRLIRCYTL